MTNDSRPGPESDVTGAPPSIVGDVVSGSIASPVAVCTLGSRSLLPAFAGRPEIAVAGRVFTENVGVERMVQNLVAFKTLRFLIVCGRETRHRVGQTIISLHRSGLDVEDRVIGSEAPEPLLPNLTPDRASGVPRAGHRRRHDRRRGRRGDPARARALAELPVASPAADDSAVVPATHEAVVERVTATRDPVSTWSYDPVGYFLVLVDRARRLLRLEQYTPGHRLLRVIEGRRAEEISHTVVRLGQVTLLAHAAYLGRELAKAEAALTLGLEYEQDRPLLRRPSPSVRPDQRLTRRTPVATVLAIAAHPDDELSGPATWRSWRPRATTCTSSAPPVARVARSASRRSGRSRAWASSAWSRCAAPAGRSGAREVWFLDFVDPWMEIGGEALAIDADPPTFCSALAERIGALKPDIVITHGSNGEYGHPQHVYTHRAVRAALGLLAPWQPPELLTWCANTGDAETDRVVNQDDPADIALDVSPWFDRKLAAAQAHVSQHAMFLRNNKTGDIGNAIRRDEAFHRWPVDRFPPVSDGGAARRPGGRQVALTAPARNATPSYRFFPCTPQHGWSAPSGGTIPGQRCPTWTLRTASDPHEYEIGVSSMPQLTTS